MVLTRLLGVGAAGEVDVDFLAWLASVASQATQSAERHQVLSIEAEALTADIEKQFKLRHIIVRLCQPSMHTKKCKCICCPKSSALQRSWQLPP